MNEHTKYSTIVVQRKIYFGNWKELVATPLESLMCILKYLWTKKRRRRTAISLGEPILLIYWIRWGKKTIKIKNTAMDLNVGTDGINKSRRIRPLPDPEPQEHDAESLIPSYN